MRQKLLKIALAGAAGFIVPYAVLSTVTRFLLEPSLTVCSLVVLSAIAAYVPRNGVPIAIALLVIGGVFAVSTFLISSAFSAVPQPRGSMLIPLGSTAVAWGLLMVYGNRRSRSGVTLGPRQRA